MGCSSSTVTEEFGGGALVVGRGAVPFMKASRTFGLASAIVHRLNSSSDIWPTRQALRACGRLQRQLQGVCISISGPLLSEKQHALLVSMSSPSAEEACTMSCFSSPEYGGSIYESGAVGAFEH